MGKSPLSGVRIRLSLALRGERAIGRVYRPVLFSLGSAGVVVQTDVNECMEAVGLPGSEELPPPDQPVSDPPFPAFYNTEALTRVALWRVVRQLSPRVVVETGIANGVSTRTILAALRANGHGHLYSFDVDPRTAKVVTGDARTNWSPIILDRRKAMSELRSWVKEGGHAIDLWYHDSDHGYDWQMNEFALARRSLAPGGLLMSDDVDGNEAFAHFAAANPTWTHSALFDSRKVVGFSRVSTGTG